MVADRIGLEAKLADGTMRSGAQTGNYVLIATSRVLLPANRNADPKKWNTDIVVCGIGL
ncbi:hypothetical protein IWQ55_001516 [Labrenzia sp. EL_208]|nr:hypothetical protein [Labrenzia sp. EL_142]MBG6154791.1 hypothetical protein [Labrenzia sp. EL_162]MBG6174233.1 hypothetical protein [Labrenzia sp. EL_132]MBG6193079.1 hypothetical protein [Labrenzia sp. EL_159]MBG6199466.1 hypothetical protein [Labrenzia sp. EL_13]MBG6209553.1 hypothetical protein [Labrenzia sp. EL_126]MBG6228311.1 hypothetical protein [Labrenzia sp. EL_208]